MGSNQSHLRPDTLQHHNTRMPSPETTRSFPRLPIAFPVFVHGKDHDGRQFLEFATVVNVSATGVAVLLRKVPGSKHVHMEIPISPGLSGHAPNVVRIMKAKIVRTEPRENCTLVGLQFERPLVPTERPVTPIH